MHVFVDVCYGMESMWLVSDPGHVIVVYRVIFIYLTMFLCSSQENIHF